MSRPFLGALVALLALLTPVVAGAQHAAPAPADLIVTADRIYTSSDAQPFVRAMAIRDMRIVFAGSLREVTALRGPATRTIDFPGRTIVPGLQDAHGHLLGLGQSLSEVDLNGTSSYQQVIARVAERAKRTPPGQWVTGNGWDQNDWGNTSFPTHDALSRAVPDHPVALSRVDGHAVLANAKAMALA
ncbi:MAG: amidohydrolase family protein, partial [Gemmatimonadaceae bacterium]